MSRQLKLYVTIIIALGIAFIIDTISLTSIYDIKSFIIFTVLSILAESLLIPTPGESAISVGLAIGLAAILVLGVPEAAWIAGIGIMLRFVSHQGKRVHIFNTPWYKTLFNGANIALSAGIAGICFQMLGGTQRSVNFNSLLVPLLACIFVYIIINETIISGLMAIVTGEGFIYTWWSNLVFAARDCITVAPIGVLMAIAYIKYDILGIMIFLGPLLLARYTYWLYADMRRIYIDTVKSLSQAIEVKDPYTKGHSMRVSEFAYDLGARLKLPHRKLEDIKMAAILHDIGKIGIEESILNKPGNLTKEEFDKIKQHPENGVKIIQSIRFLRNVADIIISHHEKMDGTGYPKGKKQGEITAEAAILSIADVYDALTSDRPYRKALTKEQALSIIEEGKGSHFESHFADEFIKMIEEQGSEAI
ncbi:MAG: HD-GYP domain-containing protein [Lutisporaceae bacterium]